MAHHREYGVGHSHAGFTLDVRDYPRARHVGRAFVERALAALGHPCCFRGLGRLEPIGEVAHRALSAAVAWEASSGRLVARIPLTVDQALALVPSYRDDIGPDGWITVDGEDEHGDVWADARLVAVRCDDCGELVDAGDRWSARVRDEHAPTCPAR